MGLVDVAVLMHQQRNLVAEREMNAEDTPAPAQAAIVDCVNSTPATPGDEAEAATQPAIVATLKDEWHTAIAQVATEAQDPARYYTCMDAARIPILVDSGQPATEPGEMISALGPDESDGTPSLLPVVMVVGDLGFDGG